MQRKESKNQTIRKIFCLVSDQKIKNTQNKYKERFNVNAIRMNHKKSGSLLATSLLIIIYTINIISPYQEIDYSRSEN